jgi:hypothetical protein
MPPDSRAGAAGQSSKPGGGAQVLPRADNTQRKLSVSAHVADYADHQVHA